MHDFVESGDLVTVSDIFSTIKENFLNFEFSFCFTSSFTSKSVDIPLEFISSQTLYIYYSRFIIICMTYFYDISTKSLRKIVSQNQSEKTRFVLWYEWFLLYKFLWCQCLYWKSINYSAKLLVLKRQHYWQHKSQIRSQSICQWCSESYATNANLEQKKEYV